MLEDNEEYRLPKQQIARSFSIAAKDYQQVNQLQQTVADRLLERLDLISINPVVVLDLGSGPGTSSARLAKYFGRARIIETDLSHAMLLESGKKAPRLFSRRVRLCSDAEMMAVRSASVDLVFSNLMLQWCNKLDLVFNEIRRVLQANGLFIFATFGPDTLMELRKSWQEADAKTHVNAFFDMHDIGDALIRAGMENPVMDTEKITVQYEDVYGLMRDLKRLGAHNINSGRRKTLTGKGRLNNMLAAYEKRRIAGKLPATYEVVYGHAWLPARASAVRVDENTLAFPVSSLKSGKRQ